MLSQSQAPIEHALEWQRLACARRCRQSPRRFGKPIGDRAPASVAMARASMDFPVPRGPGPVTHVSLEGGSKVQVSQAPSGRQEVSAVGEPL